MNLILQIYIYFFQNVKKIQYFYTVFKKNQQKSILQNPEDTILRITKLMNIQFDLSLTNSWDIFAKHHVNNLS